MLGFLQIILLLGGITYGLRRRKLKKLTPEQFPEVPPDKFTEWRTYELESTKRYLWSSWGFFLIGTPTYVALIYTYPRAETAFWLIYNTIFIVMLVFTGISGSKAAKLKKQLKIDWQWPN